jgi:hypothetical protein
MAELKVYCGTEFLGTVPRPALRCDCVQFMIPGKNPEHPKEYWIAQGLLGDPTAIIVSYEIHPYWLGEDGEPPIPYPHDRQSEGDGRDRWAVEFVMVVPESGSTRELLHKIPGWRPAPPKRIISLPIV